MTLKWTRKKSTFNSWEFCSAEIRMQSKKALALPKMWTDQLQRTYELRWKFLEKIVSSALGSVNACHLGILVISEVLMGECSCVSKQDHLHAKTIKSLKKYRFLQDFSNVLTRALFSFSVYNFEPSLLSTTIFLDLIIRSSSIFAANKP